MNDLDKKALLLKAKIEFGPENDYVIKNGGLGRTLVINTGEGREKASIVRKKAPTDWEGLYVMVVYCSTDEKTEKENYNG
jgi:hypothetical protein